ncbi:TRAP transporter large permease [Pseudoruegeria sp. SK021]|uniref:TRAP transporter large permease n=1 Tax=Pseudoruegeria sp. SK021 TaxID=1933035 RepID=UPI000A2481DD|nr:TRAP transporter large permease [Pseudoruegeria sp. SK021]OSP53997.1 C4-dicarboxylate ABC transporter [Pseudoruegeria sp. SK021]
MSVVFGGFVLLVFSGMPIVFALGVGGLLAIQLMTDVPLSIVAQRIYGGVNSFTLMAIPFFVTAGVVMEAGGIARRFVDLAAALVGWITGSLYLVGIVTGTGLAAISGSGSADTAAVGSILMPEMKRRGYDVDLAASIIAASGALAPIIPPSIIMIIVAVTANESIGAMFLGGVVPGLMIAVAMGVTCWLIARRGGEAYRDHTAFSGRALWQAFMSALPALTLPVIIVGGIVGGIFTATEAACIALIVTLLVSLLIYREIRLVDLPALFVKSVGLSAAVLMIVSTASVFSWIIATLGAPEMLDTWMRSITSSPIIFLLIVNIFLLIIGMFMESISAILIIVPVLMPIAVSFGIDPVQFGVMTTLNLSIGLITPPYGICLFVSAVVAERRIEQVSRRVWIPLIPMLIVLGLVAYVPEVVLTLPRMFFP